MATKKKTQKRQTKAKRTTSKKVTPTKKLAKKRGIPNKKSAKKPAPKKATVKTKAVGGKTVRAKTVSVRSKRVGEKSQNVDTVALPPERPEPRSGRQSGHLQGLSTVEGADSESVDELIEEGNAFEADVVSGVENAGDAAESEVRTHEVPQDDVPGEYLDKD